MIRFDLVSKRYPSLSRPALRDVRVQIDRGEFVFLVGPSGSGKSSFLRLMLREERATSGAVHVLGQNLGEISTRKVPYFRRNLGVVFQDFRLLPNKTVFENVAFALRVIGQSRGYIHTAVPNTLKLVGLDGKAKRMPHELSGGEQQRVAIARAIVNKPKLLLADEPTGNLDPATSAGIMALLESISASGTTIVMATHEAGIVDQMQRRVIELNAGVIVRDERSAGYALGGTRSEEIRPLETSFVTGKVAAVAPKLTAEVMRDAPPLYIEPEATDELTEQAAVITRAATGQIDLGRPVRTDPAPVDPAVARADAVHGASYAERLGLQGRSGPRPGDVDQEVGPTR